ncbi:MAG: type II toxin-antitoxin system VapC family toxin [Armatimonadetes bacterium]|nr:type II toxin-antitoxin system VapC family toxin [Armatimonadota bacterium]
MAERRNFHDALEPIVYLNSSFVIACWDDRAPFHFESQTFLRRMQAEGIVLVVSDFTYNEVAFYILRQALLREAKRIGQRWENVLRTLPHIYQTAMNEVENVKAEMDLGAVYLSTSESAKDLAFTLMRRYNLLPTDAYHVAVALDAGVNAFVSLDEDLLNVDGIIVYTCL